jgi:SAM-dependent methyltransferase
MSLAYEYKRQLGWRDWPTAFAALPPLAGQTVLDIGCGPGDQAAELATRGARVIGLDTNEALLREAQARSIPNAEFRRVDLSALPELGVEADGLWCSFAAAYFPELPSMLKSWTRRLRPGGWIAVTEIDDLFGHEPIGARTRALFDAYARDALDTKRYDFHMGRKLQDHLGRCGFTVTRVLTLADQEFSFTGPAPPEVVEAWRARLDRMKLLATFCGSEFDHVRTDFLGCLTRPDHRSSSTVYFCFASWP